MFEKIQQFFLRREQTIFKGSAILVVCIFLLVSFWKIAASPATWFDEGINMGIAKSLVTERVYSLPVAPGQHVEQRSFLITTNYPVLLPVALFIKLGGASLAVARLPQIIYLGLFSLLAFTLVKKVYQNKWAALGTVALIVTFAPFYANGKAVLGEVPGLVFFLAALLVLPQTAKPRRLFLVGLLLGLSVATKPFYLVALGAVGLSEIVFFWKEKKVLFFRVLFIALGLAPPFVGWLYSILQSFSLGSLRTTVGFYANSYAAPNPLAQVASNALRFITESTPVHFLILFLVASVFIYQRLIQKRGTEIELAIIFFIVVTLGWYLKTPGWYRYFFPAHVLLFLVVPAALIQARFRTMAFIFLSSLIVVQAGHAATKVDDPLYYAPAPTSFAHLVEAQVPENATILTINTPSISFLLSDRPVYQFLQINPALFFGRAQLEDNRGLAYDFIITSGSTADTALENIETVLAQQYVKIAGEDAYSLFKKK